MTRPRIAVVGGGIAGLTTAHRLIRPMGPAARPLPEVTVLESDSRVGGKVRSVSVADLSLPAGADSFVARKPGAIELCRELGLGNQLVAPAASAAYLWTPSGLVPFLKDSAFGIPPDVGDVLRWPGLSRRGRLRALQDLVRKPRKDPGDESLGGLLRRRLGNEATDLAVAPLLAGLHAGDVDRLSVQATFPEFVAWERSQGSLIRGAQAARRAAQQVEPGPMFVRPDGGIERLTEALVDAIGRDRVRCGNGVKEIRPRGTGWAVRATTDEELEVDAVVLATPAFESARLLDQVSPTAAAELIRIPHASTGVVLLVYPEGTVSALPEGTGFVVPAGSAPMTAATWLSNKWPSQEFGSRAVVRCYVGGVGAEDVVGAPDEEIVDAVSRHLAAVLRLPSRARAWRVHRWPRSMPQYEVGHADRVRAIRSALPAGIFVAGSSYGGVGIPDVIRDATETAAAATRAIERTQPDRETVP